MIADFDWLTRLDPAGLRDCDREAFETARRAYDSPQRVYHTWNHILACLTEFAAQTFDNPRTVLMALLYHDAVYVPGRKDNEARSAALAERVLTDHSRIPESERQAIGRMILLTAHHHAAHQTLTTDEKKLIDIDLSILGQPWPVYQAYAAGVRQEFCPAVVSESRFRVGRYAFLRQVLKQPNIFLTKEMAAKLEVTARSNIATELDALKAQAGLWERICMEVL